MKINRTVSLLDLNRFNEELKNAIAQVQIVLKFGEDNLRFTVDDTWTATEDALLDDFIANFVDSDPEDKVPLIIDYAKAEAATKHFHNIDYKKELTVRLQKKSEIVQGEMRTVTWYRHMTYEMINGIPTRVYTVPAIKTETSWLRDVTGFAIAKLPPIRTWYNRDGTENVEKKVMADPYYYEEFEQIDEGVKRRTLLVKSIQIPSLNYLASVLMPLGVSYQACVLRGRAFLDLYQDLFDKFEKNSSTVTDNADPNFGKKTIIVSLEDQSVDGFNADHNEWLDKSPNALGGLKTIRQWLIEEFSI